MVVSPFSSILLTDSLQTDNKVRKNMNKTMIDIDSIDLKKLRELLNYGDCTEIASMTGFSPNYVYRVLDPKDKRMNKKILEAAFEIIEENSSAVEVDEEIAKQVAA